MGRRDDEDLEDRFQEEGDDDVEGDSWDDEDDDLDEDELADDLRATFQGKEATKIPIRGTEEALVKVNPKRALDMLNLILSCKELSWDQLSRQIPLTETEQRQFKDLTLHWPEMAPLTGESFNAVTLVNAILDALFGGQIQFMVKKDTKRVAKAQWGVGLKTKQPWE